MHSLKRYAGSHASFANGRPLCLLPGCHFVIQILFFVPVSYQKKILSCAEPTTHQYSGGSHILNVPVWNHVCTLTTAQRQRVYEANLQTRSQTYTHDWQI